MLQKKYQLENMKEGMKEIQSLEELKKNAFATPEPKYFSGQGGHKEVLEQREKLKYQSK